MEDSPEKASAPMSEKGKIEFGSSLLQGQPLKEHFEVEIPAEEILRQTVAEPAVEPARAASGEKAEAPRENAVLSTVFEQEPVEMPEHSGKAEKAAIDQVRGQQADMPGFAFQGSEGQGQNDSEAFSSQPVQETQAGKSENMMNNLSFEKILEAPVKEPSASPRVAPLAAEVQEKVQAGIKVSVEQGGGEVKMKLNPESLGEVRIKLNVASGIVRAEITVENLEVKRIIETDSAFLRDSLGAHGLTLDKCVVEVGRSFEAGERERSGESLYGDEQKPMKDREQEKQNRENSGWHRHFRKNQTRHEDGGVDFFI
ncbi:MAG: flagellar hook-length control protein FliK [Deltaproteobacteria bacterium]|nr:flagellar hook-length control protein FliK [Deltaproteobacteria bacterium]